MQALTRRTAARSTRRDPTAIAFARVLPSGEAGPRDDCRRTLRADLDEALSVADPTAPRHPLPRSRGSASAASAARQGRDFLPELLVELL